MYFRNRADAGRKLAAKLGRYKKSNTAVVALSEGSTIVGAQIAMALHSSMVLLLTENIFLPGEIEAIASLSSAGTFTYNNMFSPGQLEDLIGEYHQYIEEKRLQSRHHLNILIGHDGEININRLRHHVVILVSDGLINGMSLDIAQDFFKTISIKKLVIATPNASVNAVDKMHLVGDEIHCMGVLENYISIDHYFDDNTIPSMDDLFRMMKHISLEWKM